MCSNIYTNRTLGKTRKVHHERITGTSVFHYPYYNENGPNAFVQPSFNVRPQGEEEGIGWIEEEGIQRLEEEQHRRGQWPAAGA
jgi:hypothetical protein